MQRCLRLGGADARMRPIYTALLGGSFNPAHGGHRSITVGVLQELGLDEAWWLVSPGNPLKPKNGMAPVAKRFASAQRQARLAPIRVTALEQRMGTRYTYDSLCKIVARWPKRRFVWIMGADNLAQFSQWKNWRAIARLLPIVVVCRPGYDRAALFSPAIAWLRKYIRPVGLAHYGKKREGPELVILRLPPDSRSATSVRERNPVWIEGVKTVGLRDSVSHLRVD